MAVTRSSTSKSGLVTGWPKQGSTSKWALGMPTPISAWLGPRRASRLRALHTPDEINYDCNSQIPSGSHNGRTIHYVFGRYPAEPDGDEYPVLDLVICHGDFLNADHTYVHENKHIRGFGSYGDILIRDRKMYVAPTPFGLMEGAAHQCTLVLPSTQRAPARLRQVGALVRREADEAVVAYRFDLRTNELTPEMVANPAAGAEHHFSAFRLRDDPADAVAMRALRLPTDGRCDDERLWICRSTHRTTASAPAG